MTDGDPVPAAGPLGSTPDAGEAATPPASEPPATPAADAAPGLPGEAPVVYGTDPSKLVPIGVPCKLDRRIIKGWSGLLGTVTVGGGGYLAEWLWLGDAAWWPLPYLWGTVIAASIVLALGLATPVWAWRNWSYVIREHDVVMKFGIVWKTVRSVPRLRIQHVDVEMDPIDRLLGLASVTLYTAGSSAEDAQIPGLRREVAEALREELLITQEQAEHILEDVAGASGGPTPGPGDPDAPDPRPHD